MFGQSVTFTATVTGTTPTGSVTFMDGATTLCNAVTLVSGQAPCLTSALSVASHSLTAVYSGDGINSGSTSAPLTQVVNKAATTATLSAHTPNPSLVGAPIAVTASVAVTPPGTGTPTGTITVSDGAANCLITLPATSCNLVPTSAGAKTLTATYAGDANFNGSTSPGVAHTVNNANSSTALATSGTPSVFGQSVTFTATVTGTTPTGSVTFMDGATTLCNAVTLVSGQAPCLTSALSVASHSLTAVYSGDGINSGSTSAPLTQVVNKAATTSTLSAHTPNPSLVGAPIAVTASVAVTPPGTGTPTGTITVSDGTANCLITLPATSCNLVPTSAGAKTLTATYAGDANFNGSTSPGVAHTVNKASTTATLSAHTPNPSLVGAPIAVTASVAVTPPGTGTPTGTITVSDGAASCLITLPATSCNLVPSSAGAKTLTASYAGDANFNGSTSPGVAHTVNNANSSTALATSGTPSVFGQSVTFTATVTGTTPTGSVTFMDGATTLCNAVTLVSGQAPCLTSALSVASHSLTAVYSGDGINSGSTSAPLTQVVNKAATTSTLSAHTPNPSLVGAPIAVTASVAVTPPGTGTPTGTITVSDGAASCLITLPATSCNLVPTSPGAKTLTATYAGDANFNGSTSPGVAHTVNNANSSTALATSGTPSVFGQSVTFTATVTGTTPTGSVTFMDGATTLCNAVTLVSGQAPCLTSALSVASHSLTAVYSGDGINSGSTSAPLTQVVNKAATTSTLSAHTPNPSLVGAPIAVTASVAVTPPGTGTPTGTITVSDGAANCLITLPATSCNLVPSSAGAKTLTATYAGDANFNGSTSPGVAHTVNKASTTSTISAHTPNPSLVGAPIAVTASVAVTPPGTGTPTGTITVSDGTASCLITLPATSCNLVPSSAGAKTLTASYAGDANFNGSTSPGVAHTVNNANSSTALATSGTPSVFGQSVTFTATVTGTTPTGSVTFMDGATTLCNAVTLVSGQAPCLTSALSVASHSLTAVYSGDGINSGSTSAPLTQVVNKAATTSTLSAHTPNPSLVGAPIAVTASVAVTPPGTGTPTGTITVSDGAANCLITLPATSCNLVPTSAGAKTLTATYAGAANFNGSTSPGVAHTVNKASTTSTISAHTPNPSLVGAPIAVTASVAVTPPGTGTPTGTITVSDGTASCLITLPATSCNLVPSSVGAKTLTASYSGDANFNGSTSPGVAHTVTTTACTYSVSPLDLSNQPKTAGTPSIVVTTPAGCPVTATSFQPWVTVGTIVPGGGTTTVNLNLLANGGAARATAIVLAGRLFLITQVAGP